VPQPGHDTQVQSHETSVSVPASKLPTTLGSRERFLELYLDVTNQCNLRCVMCKSANVAGPPTQELSKETFEHIAAALFPNTADAVLSCVHEPLMVKNFFHFVGRAAAFEVPQITITTNGQLMHAKTCRKIVESGITDLHVSVDGASTEVYESIRLGGKMSTLLENLAAFAEVRGTAALPRLQIQAVIMPRNYADISRFVDVFARFRPRRLVFVHQNLQPPEERLRPLVERELDEALRRCVEENIIFEELPAFFHSTRNVLDAFGVSDSAEATTGPGCTDPLRFMRIQPDGSVFFCSGASIPAGNLNRQDIADIWNGSEYQRMRQAWQAGTPPSGCRSCTLPLTGTTRLTHLRRRVDRILAPVVDAQGPPAR
jgi:MoaA/NifB/PqqE/SkfB family radical SAM enzyme